MSHHHHHNYPNHGRLSPTGGDSRNGSLYSEGHPDLLTSFDPVSNNTNPTAQCSAPVSYDPLYSAPVQQQQTHSPNPTYPSYQQLSEERYHSGQMRSGSYNRTSPSSSSADPWRPSSLDVPGGGSLQGLLHYPSHADLPMSPPSSDFRSPHSVYSSASSFLQYQPLASFAHPAVHSPSRGPVHTPAATHTHYQQPMAISLASYLDRSNPSSRNTTELPHARVPTAPSPVPFDIPPETSEPTIKKRKRANARQLAALNRMYARTAFPSTEGRQQLASDLDMSAQSVQNWFKNKRQAIRQGGRNLPDRPVSQVTVTPPSPVSAILAVLAVLAVAFVVART